MPVQDDTGHRMVSISPKLDVGFEGLVFNDLPQHGR